MKVLSVPLLDGWKTHESGIRRVVEAYSKYLPMFGVELVTPIDEFDIMVVHAGTAYGADVAHCHGLYWTADYKGDNWEWRGNEHVIKSVREAKIVTVPASWVAETFERDMKFSPDVIGHGIDWDDWQHDRENRGFVLWNKNRAGDVCDPYPVTRLAQAYTDIKFVTTFARGEVGGNVTKTGVIPHEIMKQAVQECAVYLATTKETFGIGTLEAMAAGKPILGFGHGGILDMVEHGVNGYLAAPGDFQDLAKGLRYCLNNADVLGTNGREIAQDFTWEKQIRKVVDVYERAAVKEEPVVDIIIPVFNKHDHQLRRAVDSALGQNEYLGEVIVVNDGSKPEKGEEYKELMKEYPDVTYLEKENGGVATARNYGIKHGKSQYVMCLDSDDALDPQFLTACVPPLEEDRSLGVTFTGLYYYKEGGQHGLSEWPDGYEYDKFFKKRQNQVPTAAVFRRVMWKRLGGYKQRYAPTGAGAEDCEFWFRAGSIGWGGKKVTDAGLFLYSWMSGFVSGNPDYKEMDWQAWHPWAKDGLHPFASLATAKRRSHPVRQYDEPAVSVIIPVGPGHVHDLENALDSLEAQTLRRWEAVVVDDAGGHVKDMYNDAYPYVKWHDTGGVEVGTGRARNIGVDNSRADLIVYLDADDFLFPDAIKTMFEEWERTGEAIYTGYLGRAVIEDESELSDKVRNNIILREDNNEKVIKYESQDFDCKRALRQPEDPPYIWCNITTMFPKAWHYEVGGFDEAMLSWEDVLYWYKMAWIGKCFYRIPEPLMMYKFYSGSRRDKGIEKAEELFDYIRLEKSKINIEKVSTMGCKCTGGANPPPQMGPQVQSAPEGAQVEMENDNDYVLVQYLSTNKGQHSVIGGASKKFYGYRKGGETFLLRHEDLAVQPHMYLVVDNMNRTSRTVETAERHTPESPQPLVDNGPTVEIQVAHLREDDDGDDPNLPDPEVVFDLQTLPAVTQRLETAMLLSGLDTPEKILQHGVDSLIAIKGLGELKANMIYDYVAENYGTD